MEGVPGICPHEKMLCNCCILWFATPVKLVVDRFCVFFGFNDFFAFKVGAFKSGVTFNNVTCFYSIASYKIILIENYELTLICSFLILHFSTQNERAEIGTSPRFSKYRLL
jgi:hypothetical protein